MQEETKKQLLADLIASSNTLLREKSFLEILIPLSERFKGQPANDSVFIETLKNECNVSVLKHDTPDVIFIFKDCSVPVMTLQFTTNIIDDVDIEKFKMQLDYVKKEFSKYTLDLLNFNTIIENYFSFKKEKQEFKDRLYKYRTERTIEVSDIFFKDIDLF